MKKRAWIALYTAAGLLTPVGLTTLSPTTALAATNPVLHYGSRGSAVQQLQRKLNALGFKVGTADGDFGPATLSGVKQFQKSRHLLTDGVVGPNTWGALNRAASPSSKTPTSKPKSSTPTTTVKKTTTTKKTTTSSVPRYPGRLIRYGVRGYDVKEVQLQLNRLGFNTGYADGVYGPKTYVGVKKFQRAHHLLQDGVVGPKTWPILFGTPKSTSSSSSSSSSSTPSSRGSSLPTVTYTVYDFFGTNKGTYSTEAAAQKVVQAYPRGIVKDSTGKVVYTKVGYAAYTDPAHLVGVYFSWNTAKSKAGAAGYVVNIYNQVDKQPSEYYSLTNGKWESSKYGVQGSDTPPSADIQTGIRYLPVTPSGGAVNSVYYPLEDSKNNYIGSKDKSFPWENPFRTANLTFESNQTPTQLDNFLKSEPLYGLGYSYLDAEKYGSNAVYLMTHSILETGWGTSSIAYNKNNLFGYGAYDSSPGNDAGSFPTDDYAIHFESWIVRNSYLDKTSPSGYTNRYTSLGPTLDGMSKGGYATDPNWSAAIAGIVNNYADSSGNAFSTVQSAVINPTASGPVNYQNEPVYPTYGYVADVPSFPANTTAIAPNPNVALDDVKTFQDALNAEGYGPLTVDGAFGNQTEAAVTSFQKNNGLPVTGKVDSATWNKLFTQNGLQPGETLQVSQMEMSYHSNLTLESVSGSVTSPSSGSGFTTWEPLIHFTNVYRIEPASGSQVVVYTKDQSGNYSPYSDSDGQVYLHEGDYVSNGQQGQAVSGWVQANFVQWRQGAPVKVPGYVKSSDIQMPKDDAGVPTMPTYNGIDPSHE